MKILTSYFYQIRNFKPNMIPLSTCISDPKWFHNNRDINYYFKDKNNVYNGLRAEPFVPTMAWGECCGPKNCLYKPDKCKFLREYSEQINKLDFKEMIERFNSLAARIQSVENFKEEIKMVLMFL